MYILLAVVALLFFAAMMLDSVKDGNCLHLYDNWPGPIHSFDTLGEFYNQDTHNTPAPRAFNPGDKACIRTVTGSLGVAGLSIFTYLQAVGHSDAAVAIAAKAVMVPDVTLYPYRLTNQPDANVSVADGLCAVALTAMDDRSYGWFWTGGICPSDLISALDGTFPTDDSLVAGDFTTVALSADAIGFGVIAATTSAVGYADAAD